MKLTNTMMPGPNGGTIRFLRSRETANPDEWIYLIHNAPADIDTAPWKATMDDFSLKVVKPIPGTTRVEMWDYTGKDALEIRKQLMDEYMQHGFEND